MATAIKCLFLFIIVGLTFSFAWPDVQAQTTTMGRAGRASRARTSHGLKRNLISGAFITSGLVFLLVGICLNLIMGIPAQAAVLPGQGPNNGSSFSQAYRYSIDSSWDNPSNAQYNDEVYARSDIRGYGCTYYLIAQGFGFSIPTGTTVNGVLVEIERRESMDVIHDNDLYLLKAGSAVGSNHAAAFSPALGPRNAWPGSEAYASYGGSSDLWGTSWSPSDINDPNFGVEVRACNIYGTYISAYIDHIRITVYYTPSAVTSTTTGMTSTTTSSGSTTITSVVSTTATMTSSWVSTVVLVTVTALIAYGVIRRRTSNPKKI